MTQYLLAPAAESDLDSIWEYIARDSIDAADRWVAKLFEAFEVLAANPAIGHTREAPRSSLLLKRVYQQSQTSSFLLLLGRLRAIVTKRYSGAPSFQLGTPTAIIAVRGTQFYVELNSHEVTEVDVEQGLAQVTSLKDSDDFVLVKPGFSTRVGTDMIPEIPSPTDSIRPDLRDQQETDRQGAPNPAEGRQPLPSQSSPQKRQESDGPSTVGGGEHHDLL